MFVRIVPLSADLLEPFVASVVGLYADDPGPAAMSPARARAQAMAMLSGEHPVRGYVVLEGERPVGHVILALFWSNEFGGLMAFLDEIRLLPEARGRGLGAAVIGQVLLEARRQGYVRVELEVNRVNVRARALYERLGFEDEARDLMGVQIAPISS